MHRLIGHTTAAPSQPDAWLQVLVNGVASMPGCLSDGMARNPQQPGGLWITNVWTDPASHQAPLQPSVQAAIAQGRPIARMASHTETEPIGGFGIG